LGVVFELKKLTYQTRFIAKSTTIKSKAIGPFPTATPSSFHKLHGERGERRIRQQGRRL